MQGSLADPPYGPIRSTSLCQSEVSSEDHREHSSEHTGI
jgi:hypothetical protein